MCLPADLHAREIVQPSTDLQAGVTARPVICDLNAKALVQSAADHVSLSPDEALAQSADDLAVPHPLEQLVADLAAYKPLLLLDRCNCSLPVAV